MDNNGKVRRSSHQKDVPKDYELDNIGYIQIFVKPLNLGGYGWIFEWLGIHEWMNRRYGTAIAAGGASFCIFILLLFADIGLLIHRIISVVLPLISIASVFYWLSMCLGKSWTSTNVYICFCSIIIGEFIAQLFMGSYQSSSFIHEPMMVLSVLIPVGCAALMSSLSGSHSGLLVAAVSIVRYIACTMLLDLPQSLRPFIAYVSGISGVIGSKYMETLLKPPVSAVVTHDGKIPVIRRRRSSSSSAMHNSFSIQRPGRRTSLPALIHKNQSSTGSYETAIIGEAHGLITDMLADATLPPHIVNGLRAVSNLLKPPENHTPSHKPKVSPLVSLSEANSYGSDSEDSPYTGERPSSLPKRLRRSLPPSLLRRMSTSTWTTTTSATGLPTLETELCRTRSSSFRHNRDPAATTPGSSPPESRSNSPSPSSPVVMPTTLTIPKSRSFNSAPIGGGTSLPTSPAGPHVTQKQRSPHDMQYLLQPSVEPKQPTTVKSAKSPNDSGMGLYSDSNNSSLVNTSGILAASTPVKDISSTSGAVARRLNITSDYESNDSPSSSDHSDHLIVGPDEGLVSTARMSGTRPLVTSTSGATIQVPSTAQSTNSEHLVETASDSIHTVDSDLLSASDTGAVSVPSATAAASTLHHRRTPSPLTCITTARTPAPASSSTTSSSSPICSSHTTDTTSEPSSSIVAPCDSSSPTDHLQTHVPSSNPTDAPVDVSAEKSVMLARRRPVQIFNLADLQNDLDDPEVASIARLSTWDFPVFDLADQAPSTALSQVAYRLFSEVGLFETFRIPTTEFLTFFHALELGYREKPYHNRVHATDVLHGVFYLTTQPIPGFTQVSLETDIFNKQASSSKSDSELSDRSAACCQNFTAEDSYGIMAGNLPPLELMALYAAAAMHDYDHPGRTNAFLVTTNSELAVLYNDRSVLENHHAASAWHLLLSDERFNWIRNLEKGEFKRFRFLVIEAILATDLKRHFEMLAEFNAKMNDDDAPGIIWTSETDRLLVSNMIIKLADINGPCKVKDLHVSWTYRITEEFYEQGDEEARLGLPISPYMDRRHPQLAKLQESFINHLVAPLCNAVAAAGLLPGSWVENQQIDSSEDNSSCKDTDDDDDQDSDSDSKSSSSRTRKIHCALTKNLKDNHDLWVAILKEEAAHKDVELPKPMKSRAAVLSAEKDLKQEMEPITEEDTPPSSAKDINSCTASQLAQLSNTQNCTQATPTTTPSATSTTQVGNNRVHNADNKTENGPRKSPEVT